MTVNNPSKSQNEKLLSQSNNTDEASIEEDTENERTEFGVTELALRQYNINSGCEYLFLLMSFVPSWIIFAIYGLDYLFSSLVIYFNVMLSYPLTILIGKLVMAYIIPKRYRMDMRDSDSESTFSNTNALPQTVLTSNGLYHSRPYFPGFMTPNGGDVFIPYQDIENVLVGVTPTVLGSSVTKVDITGTAPLGTDKGKYVQQGFPTFLEFSETTNSFKISILGLSDPYKFQRMILEKIDRNPTVTDQNKISS